MVSIFSVWLGSMVLQCVHMTNVFQVFSIILTFVLNSLGFSVYTITRKEDARRVQKRLGHRCAHILNGQNGFGYGCGRWYLLHIDVQSMYDDNPSYTIWIVTTSKMYQSLITPQCELEHLVKKTPKNECDNHEHTNKNDDHDEKQNHNDNHNHNHDNDDNTENEKTEHTKIRVFDRTGTFSCAYYFDRQITIEKYRPRSDQADVINDIVGLYSKKRHVVVFLQGAVGTGKTMISLLLTQRFHSGVSLCHTFQPWRPGDYLADLYNDVEPTPSTPLIIVFDEVDVVLEMIHTGIPNNPSFLIMVQNKCGWNKFLDHIQWGMFPNVILLMTSNRGSEFIHTLDPSYLRHGRVDKVYTLDHPKLS